MAETRERREREKSWFAIWLAGVAGFVNAVAYLLLFRVGVSHMTGNAVQTGLDGSTANWSAVLVWLLPVPLFIAGLLLGLLTQEVLHRLKFRSSFAIILGIEAALLLAFLVSANVITRGVRVDSAHGASFLLLVALASVAMGMQTATVHKVHGQPVRTTYVTGVLSSFAEAVVAVGVSAFDVMSARGRSPGTEGQRTGEAEESKTVGATCDSPEDAPQFDRAALLRTLLLGAVWAAFVVGAGAGAYTEFRLAAVALVFPLASLLCLIAVDYIWPIEPPSREQSQEHPS